MGKTQMESQALTVTRAGLSRDLGMQSRSPVGVAGTPVLELLLPQNAKPHAGYKWHPDH